MNQDLAYCKSAKWAPVRDYSMYEEPSYKRNPGLVLHSRLRYLVPLLTPGTWGGAWLRPYVGTPTVHRRLWDKQKGLCALCGGAMNANVACNHPDSPTIDHIRPLAKGGRNVPSNKQLAHGRCNWEKADMQDTFTVDEEISYLLRRQAS